MNATQKHDFSIYDTPVELKFIKSFLTLKTLNEEGEEKGEEEEDVEVEEEEEQEAKAKKKLKKKGGGTRRQK